MASRSSRSEAFACQVWREGGEWDLANLQPRQCIHLRFDCPLIAHLLCLAHWQEACTPQQKTAIRRVQRA